MPDVLIVGHTDTTGARARQFRARSETGQHRSRLLRDTGLDVAVDRRRVAWREPSCWCPPRRHLRSQEPPRRNHGPMSPRPRLLTCAGSSQHCSALSSVSRPPAFCSGSSSTIVRHHPPGRAVRPPSGRVVIVDVDEKSLTEIGQWPWRRDLVGTTGVAASRRRRRVSWHSTSSSPNVTATRAPPLTPDEALAAALRPGRVVARVRDDVRAAWRRHRAVRAASRCAARCCGTTTRRPDAVLRGDRRHLQPAELAEAAGAVGLSQRGPGSGWTASPRAAA